MAILSPALAALDLDAPPTIVDVGTSAGLTLQLDRCLIDYGPNGRLGPPDSPVRVACEVLHGQPPIRPTPMARRIGFDRRPFDPTDPDDARWLIACTWPDTGRLDRTRAAVALAAAGPAELRSGDAVADLPALLDEIDGPVVVTTTWAFAYLSEERRRSFAEVLAVRVAVVPCTWVSGEGRGRGRGSPATNYRTSTAYRPACSGHSATKAATWRMPECSPTCTRTATGSGGTTTDVSPRTGRAF